MPIFVGEVRHGEVRITSPRNISDHWTYLILVQRMSIIRWDIAGPPHENYPDCASRPGELIHAPHEHVWTGRDDGCAEALPIDVRGFLQVLDLFVDRINGTVSGVVPNPPPPPPEQLVLRA